ncbi:hypothetical protein KEM55_002516 [Ascosphaera atra]|nr:hypothetical protein KEM55_002516 [Ascosphaera atra]
MSSVEKVNFPIKRNIGFSDLTIEVEEEKFEVHKIVMCSASSVMAAALTKNNFEEANTGVFRIREFDADTVGRMIDYIYRGNYVFQTSEKTDSTCIPKPLPSSEGERLLEHTRVNAIADFYDILGLRQLSRSYISPVLKQHWDPDHFSEFLRLCYTSGDTKLHTLAIASTVTHSAEVSRLEGFQNLTLPASFHARA